VEKADSQGLALVRERAPFVPMPRDAQIRFADQVVLIRSPFRVKFSYAGPDQVWQPEWRGKMQLPEKIRVAVRDGATGLVLGVSSATVVHADAWAECVRAKNTAACLAARLTPDAPKREEQL
jgi:general secretion pathway protein J